MGELHELDWMKCLKVRVASRKWTETEMGVSIHNYTHGKTTHKQLWPTGNNSGQLMEAEQMMPSHQH